MAYLIHFPVKGKVEEVTTSQDIVSQVWAELTMLQHVRSPKTMAPLIDQARIYYEDGRAANWRTAGLLYYYSFLNIAKALLIARRAISFKRMTEVAVYHGLSATSQPKVSLPDYEIQIHPQTAGDRFNVFALLYKCATGRSWPFSAVISIRLRSVLGYCSDIADELFRLYQIPPDIIRTQSLARVVGNQAWFETLVSKSQADRISRTVPGYALNFMPLDALTNADKQDWIVAFHVSAATLGAFGLLRGPIYQVQQGDPASALQPAIVEVTKHLVDYGVPTVYDDPISKYWFFVPPVKIENLDLLWHPILSDYLVAFVLSTLLRYQPYNFESHSKDYVIGQGWCSQSSSVVLRYFLMFLTTPSRRIQRFH